jgi:hypothetical protein
MPSGFLAYGCPVPGGGAIATLQASSGNGSTPTESSTVHGAGWPYKVVAAWDTHDNVFIDPGTTTITVGAATGDSAGIASVTFYLNGNSTVVTTQTTNPDNGTYGFCVRPSTGAGGTDGNYTLYAKVVPTNGYERLLLLPVTLNSNGTITRPLRYVDFTLGSNANAGTSPGAGNAWKTLVFATGAVAALPGGAAEIVCAAGTYVEDAVGSASTNPNTRMIKIRPASGTVILTKTILDFKPNNVIQLGCALSQVVGCTLYYDKAATCGANVITNCTIVDNNGLLGPLYSYTSGGGTGQQQIFDAIYYTAIEECSIQAVMCEAWLERNNTSRVSYDAYSYQNPNSDMPKQVGRWNVDIWQPNIFHIRLHVPNNVTVASSTFSSPNTTINIGSDTLLGSVPQGQINCVTGTVAAKTITGTASGTGGVTRLTLSNTTGLINGDMVLIRGCVGSGDLVPGCNALNEVWTGITVVDGTHIELSATSTYGGASGLYLGTGNTWTSGGVVMLAINVRGSAPVSTGSNIFIGADVTARVKAGDTLWVTAPAHGDTYQSFSQSNNPIPYYDNMYWQRVRSYGLSLQLIQGQPGFSTGGGTVSGGGVAEGGVLTFSSAQAVGEGGFIDIGGTGGECLIKTTTTGTTCQCVTPIATSAVNQTWRYVQGNRNIAMIMCCVAMYGNNTNSGQIEGGQSHWIFDSCSFLYSTFQFVQTSHPAWAIEGWVIRNSIFNKLTDNNGQQTWFPPAGIKIDNCQFLVDTSPPVSFPAQATNSILQAATFDATPGSTTYGKPLTGVTKTMTPPIPYDCIGTPLGATSNIGALKA